MRKLTVNTIALGSIRHRRKEYRAMILGAGLAIFFLTTIFLMVQTIYETQRLAAVARMGSQDAILRDAERISPETLLESGLVAEVGNAYVLGETVDSKCPIGYYDKQGAAMASRMLTEGRMPEKPGEIAVEPNFLQKLRVEANVGDEIELTLNIPRGVRAEFLPDPVQVRYRIVGILDPQSIYLAGNFYSDYEYLKYPNAIVSEDTPVEPGGRAIVHRMVRYTPGVSETQFALYAEEEWDIANTLPTRFNLFNASSNEDGTAQILVFLSTLFGAVLILSACLGIANAFSARLTERRTQIGMMRAVGATSRQIRSIFGREAMLLALFIAPISIGISYLCVWGLAKLTGIATFYADSRFLPVILIASLLCVGLAAWVPLIGTSHLSPMHAIREVSLLRAKKRSKVRPRAVYVAPRLIALRNLSLYRTRRAGIAAMVALSMLMIAIMLPILSSLWIGPTVYGYEIAGTRWPLDSFVETNMNAHEGLTQSDVAEVASLPLVSSVDVAAMAQINLLLGDVTPYAAHTETINYWAEQPGDEMERENIDYYHNFKAQQNITRELLPSTIYGLNESLVTELESYVLAGSIRMDALNAGLEALIIAPDAYYQYEGYAPNDSPYRVTVYDPPSREKNVATYLNDVFRVGDVLSIIRFYVQGGMQFTEDDTLDTGANIQRAETEVAIGAVLSADAINTLNSMNLWNTGIGTLITTHSGLSALGIETAGYIGLGIRLANTPDDLTHTYLTDTLNGIAARGTDMSMFNNIQSERNMRFWQTMLQISLLAIVLLLLSMCVSLVNNAITNRVRSEKRSIGTLRAVGAPIWDITRSYQIQALVMIGFGVIIGVILCGVLYLVHYLAFYLPDGMPYDAPWGNVVLGESVFLLAIVLLCGINLSARMREITKSSIVSNIREL